jgi:thiol-disulfide isomerase/thioredoxin
LRKLYYFNAILPYVQYGKNQLRRGVCLVLVFLCGSLFACTEQQSAVNSPRQNQSLYTIALVGNDGQKVDFADFQGKVLVIEFFASWCEPCKEIAPQIDRIYHQYGPKGVAVIGVSLDLPANRDAVARYVREHGVKFPVVIDDGRLRDRTGVFSVPTVLVMDTAGNSRMKLVGARRDVYAQLSHQLEQLAELH